MYKLGECMENPKDEFLDNIAEEIGFKPNKYYTAKEQMGHVRMFASERDRQILDRH